MPVPRLTEELASRFADTALANVVREFPNQPAHPQASAADLVATRALHPAFYGSYDWHSAVHMHWLLARLLRLMPGLAQRSAIEAIFAQHMSAAAIAGECAYFERPGTRAFERTYGWAWLLMLATELAASREPGLERAASNLAPLASLIVERYLEYLPKASYPIRHGVHANSALGLRFALEFARNASAAALESLCTQKARDWFAADRNAPAAWEPSGADFLSPVLIEAELMRHVLPQREFAIWLEKFLPGLAGGEPPTIFTPPAVTDRRDPQLVHLDGLALTRAWCFRGIAASLPAEDPRIGVAEAAAERHLDGGLEGIERADYVGSHWLASFAMLALDLPYCAAVQEAAG